MIQNVIPIIGSQLNEYLKNSFGETEDRVVVTSVANNSGASSIEIDNKIMITLINVEEEKLIRNTGYNQFGGSNPSIYINLYVLFAANFPQNNYREGLKGADNKDRDAILSFLGMGTYVAERSSL